MVSIGVNKIKIHFDTSQLCCRVVHINMGLPRTFLGFSSTDILTVLSLVLHVTAKENLKIRKNSPCGGAGKGIAIFLLMASWSLKI